MLGMWSKAGARGGRKAALLTVLQNDGTVLEYHRRVRCATVLAAHPNHLVCPATALKQQGGILAGDAYLELGRVYFLLPNPASFAEQRREKVQEEEEGEAALPVLPTPPPQSVISKHQLTRILGEATRAANACEVVARKLQRAARKTRSRRHWVASLESIPEYVAI